MKSLTYIVSKGLVLNIFFGHHNTQILKEYPGISTMLCNLSTSQSLPLRAYMPIDYYIEEENLAVVKNMCDTLGILLIGSN